MRRLLPLLLLLSAVATAQQAPIRTVAGAYSTVKTSSVCVSNSIQSLMPTTALTGRTSVVLTNNNANTIYCSENSAVTIQTGLAPGQPVAQNATQTWSVSAGQTIYCVSASAAQTSGAGCTTVTEGAP